MKKISLLAAAFFAATLGLNAQEEEEKSSPLEISGFVDMYAKTNLDASNPVETSFTAGQENSFNLGMANVALSKTVGKATFVADLAWGPRAVEANGSVAPAIKQLYVDVALSDKLTVTAGNFSTHVGYEVIDAPGNFNYSTSYMFTNGPFFHTGVKATYELAEGYSLMLGFVNDNGTQHDDVDNSKFLAAQFAASPSEGLDIYVNYLGGSYKKGEDADGNEVEDLGSALDYQQVDLTATFAASEELSFGVNATAAYVDVAGPEFVNTPMFGGAALYANYAITDAVALGFRGEYFTDSQGYWFADDNWFWGQDDEGHNIMGGSIMDFTLSANIKAGDNFTLIPEVRYDTASEDIFTDGKGEATNGIATFLVGAYMSF